uniref:Reverse transcriptase domain-containing protein n=1 Tax=Tanacetum cinerariifolium TaxID=118510 RepID=A0A699I473_TANCI|nr:reverse transcriptase domain-containing protein [Tanacetum cinerariifolium]
MTQSAGRAIAAPRGGRTGGRTGRGGGRTRGRSSDQGNQGSNMGNGRNQNGDAVNDNIHGDVRNVTLNNDQKGCTYKEFLACNQKEYDGNGGAIVYTRWIEKMESVQDMSGCKENQKIMPPRMTTRIAGHATSTPRGRRIDRRTGRGGGRTRGRSSDQVNGRVDG